MIFLCRASYANSMAEAIQHIRDRPPVDVETLSHSFSAEDAADYLAGKFSFRGKPATLPLDLSWRENPHRDRNWAFQLHAMKYVISLTRAYQSTKDVKFLQRAEDLVLDWISDNMRPPNDPSFKVPSPFTWHDHATAQRVRAWLPFFEVWRRTPLSQDEELITFIRAVTIHAEALSDPDFYTSAHNHGISQDMALLAIAVAFPDEPRAKAWAQLASSRIREQANDTVSANGVHLEHSPAYHVRVLSQLTQSLEFARQHRLPLADDPGFSEKLRKMARFAAYMIQPNGRLPSIGDTRFRKAPFDENPVLTAYAENDAVLDYALSRGDRGEPGELSVVYPDEGYAILRDAWPPGALYDFALHLMFTAAGNEGLAHKHRDDLSFVLYARGHELLVDPGLHSYNYKSPGRRYVVSTSAHNTVTIDGRSAKRNKAVIEDFLLDDAYALIVASHLGYQPLQHRRTLLYVRPRMVFVVDELGSADGEAGQTDISIQEHDFQQLWHLAPEVDVMIDDTRSRVRGTIIDSPSMAITISIAQLAEGRGTAEIALGETDPLQGWVSPSHGEIIPAPVARFVASGRKATLVTWIDVSRQPALTPPPSDEGSAELLHLDADGFSVRWPDGDGWRRAEVQRGETLSVSIVNE